MSDVIIQEPSSQRSDNNIWVWRYGDPVFTPFRISFYRKGQDNAYVDIPLDFTVRFLIKADLRDDSAVIEKIFHFDAPSVFVVNIPTDEVIQLRAGKMYHVGLALYNEYGEFVRTIIADLPLRIDNSTLSNSVF